MRETEGISLEGKEVEWDGDDNVEHMWEQVKLAMVRSLWLNESWGKESKECMVE